MALGRYQDKDGNVFSLSAEQAQARGMKPFGMQAKADEPKAQSAPPEGKMVSMPPQNKSK